MNWSPLAHLVLQCWSFQSEALWSAALAGYSCGSGSQHQ
jgi:hypothetical protein